MPKHRPSEAAYIAAAPPIEGGLFAPEISSPPALLCERCGERAAFPFLDGRGGLCRECVPSEREGEEPFVDVDASPASLEDLEEAARECERFRAIELYRLRRTRIDLESELRKVNAQIEELEGQF